MNDQTLPASLMEAASPTFTLRMQLNGKAVETDCRPDTRLLTLLREHWHLLGAKPGCEVGRCGACMVWLNDAPTNACLLMAYQLQGQSVRALPGQSCGSRLRKKQSQQNDWCGSLMSYRIIGK